MDNCFSLHRFAQTPQLYARTTYFHFLSVSMQQDQDERKENSVSVVMISLCIEILSFITIIEFLSLSLSLFALYSRFSWLLVCEFFNSDSILSIFIRFYLQQKERRNDWKGWGHVECEKTTDDKQQKKKEEDRKNKRKTLKWTRHAPVYYGFCMQDLIQWSQSNSTEHRKIFFPLSRFHFLFSFARA